MAQYNIIMGFVIPQKAELNALAAEISNKVDKNYDGRIMIDIRNPAYEAFSSRHRYDEFGNISLATPWAVKGMAEVIRRTKGMNFKMDENVVLQDGSDCSDNCIIINTGDAMRKATTNY